MILKQVFLKSIITIGLSNWQIELVWMNPQ